MLRRWLQSLLRLIQAIDRWFQGKPRPDDTSPSAPPSPTIQSTPSKLPDTLLATRLAQAELTFEAPDIAPVYRKRDRLLTYQERRFYFNVLIREFSSEYAIFLKVRLGDLVSLVNEPDGRKAANNQVNCKHIDFVLCDKKSLEPIIAIELDDSSHHYPGHAERDRIKNEVCAGAGLPLYRLTARRDYPVNSIVQDIHRLINAGPIEESTP
jgi:hypothetical protein